MSERVPFPENVPGDFYVEDGCCTACGMPTTEAPELFAYAPDGHCYVRRQPSSENEMRKMVGAFTVQDVGCIRYKGRDRVVQIRLIRAGEGDQCDHLPRDLAGNSVKAWPAVRIAAAISTGLWLFTSLAGISGIQGISEQHLPGFPNDGQLRLYVFAPLLGLIGSAAILGFAKRLPSGARRVGLVISFIALLAVFMMFGGGV